MAGVFTFPAWAAVPAAGMAAAAAVAVTVVWRASAVDVGPARQKPPVAEASAPAAAEPAKAATVAPAGVQVAGLETPAPPAFDIVRVAPGGDAVVAGRGAPGARIALMEGEKILSEGKIDAGGNFVLLPQSLAAGDHALALRMQDEGRTPVISVQSVTVVVAEKAKGGVLVAMAEPGKPTAVLSDAKPAKPAGGAPAVSIRTAEVEEGGAFYATGAAAAGAMVRLYLNGSLITAVKANPAGQWSLKIAKGVTPGAYAVRADEVDPADGSVIARAEVPFDYEAPVRPSPKAVAAKPPVAPPAPGADAPVAVVAQKPAPAPAPKVEPPPAAVEQKSAPQIAAVARQPPVAVAQIPAPAPVAASPPDVEPVAAAAPPRQRMVVAVPAVPLVSDAVIAEIQTATVARGDSLWRISRKLLGQGTRYTQIYEANASQIRNPKLIYPGQVFVMPAAPG